MSNMIRVSSLLKIVCMVIGVPCYLWQGSSIIMYVAQSNSMYLMAFGILLVPSVLISALWIVVFRDTALRYVGAGMIVLNILLAFML